MNTTEYETPQIEIGNPRDGGYDYVVKQPMPITGWHRGTLDEVKKHLNKYLKRIECGGWTGTELRDTPEVVK